MAAKWLKIAVGEVTNSLRKNWWLITFHFQLKSRVHVGKIILFVAFWDIPSLSGQIESGIQH